MYSNTIHDNGNIVGTKGVMKEFCQRKIERYEKQMIIFKFLTTIFDNISKRLNWGFQDMIPVSFPFKLQNLNTQSKEIFSNFKCITELAFITESIFMDWYYQYPKKEFFHLSMYYWEYLLEVCYPEGPLLLKCIQRIRKEKEGRQQEYDGVLTEVKYEASYEKIVKFVEEMDKKNTKLFSQNKIIRNEIEMLIAEENVFNGKVNYLLGKIFYILRTESNKKTSLCFLYFMRGHMLGDIESTLALGLLYFNGRCVIKDYQRAYQLFLQAHKGFNYTGSLYLGIMHLMGLGVQKDVLLCQQYLFHGAFENHKQCIEYLKEYTDKNKFEDYKSRLEKGDHSVCRFLGCMCHHGIAMRQDVLQALEYWLLGMEHDCEHCFTQANNFCFEHPTQLRIYKNLAEESHPRLIKIWSNIRKYSLNPPELDDY
jgi:TPR repeat protein